MVGENNNHEKEEGQEIEGNLRREEDNIVNEEQKVNSRKRQRRPETWKRNIKKKKVNSGESYISEGKRVIQAKEMRKPCSDNCIHKCFNMETGSRKTIFSNFWGLSDNDLQRQFVVSHMQLLVPKYRRVIEGSNRGNNFAYYFTINGIRRRVCKTFFMNTLNIGDRLIRTSWKKSKDCAIIEKDKRGNTNSHQTVEESIKDSVRNHINSFHRIESHYLRAQTSREFIDGSLTLAQMYRFYKDDQEEKKQPYAKKCTYDTIFNTEFNISFFRPKKDQCSICESYKNGNEAEKRNRQEEYDRHVKNKVRSREEKQKDIAMGKENNNIIVSCFDLQAVLPTPCGDISTFFYKCRLNCLNFTIFEITSRNGFCYFWHEGIAMRGANEIATCLLDYLSSLPAGKDVIFYSDNCVGQNKNKIVISMYLYAINKTQLKSITHKFLTVGHTQNEGDSMHSVIEKAKKRMLRSGPIYVPSQWPPLIRAAKKEGKPYKVRELATDEFMDFKSMANGFGQKFSKNSENEKVVWNDIHVFRVEKDFPDTVFYKTDFDSDGYKKIDLSSRRSCNLSEFVLQEAYSTHPVLRDKTKEHLLELCDKNLIVKVHQPFYRDFCKTLTQN
ncbi:hypothetical protein RI129_004638 [Pyrocoelia pectoralis]|uniref:DUF7869 domain-containing protein n=1 Tax=Pyrocoelia pectoralis TaxID=417401 RepID=A0AAN7VLX0_9COLE